MKRTIIVFIIIMLIYLLIGNVLATNDIIPEDAIRIRIIPNSNSSYDQEIKLKVKEKVEYDLYNILKDTKRIEDARNIISQNLPMIEEGIDKTLKDLDYKESFDINFGLNYFPEKEYKGIKYKEGYYESVVITLGEGLGDNWWCVLFPPLCLIEAEESTDVEYTTLVKSIIDKYF